ncbi:MAG: hypothetical protein H6658_14765 [Ardenticatenaceae bacterium]|nr:hypothetical protein [Ardenticatenaceae bacterium]
MAVESYFVWLGSGRARKRGVGEGGVLLDQAARVRLPVPSGGILLDAFYEGAVADGLLVRGENGRFSCPDPPLLHHVLYHDVRFPQLEKPVVVQPLFATTSVSHIQFTEPGQLACSLCEVYSAKAEDVRRDVVVMEMVEAVVGGTAVTAASQATDTFTTNEQSLTLPQLGIFQSASAAVPPFAQRLQKLLRGVRRTFGKGQWAINWADDGEVCWLTQITRLRTRELT